MTREEFMEAAGRRYDRLQVLNDGRDFYDYEKEFITLRTAVRSCSPLPH
jgi:hypothetical protein